MSYELHLTRAEDWFEEVKEDPITDADLIAACIEAGLGLTPIGGDPDPAFMLTRQERKGGFSDLMSASLSEGQVTIKPAPPDDDAARRLTHAAQVMRARIQGDDGETYDIAPHIKPTATRQDKRRSWFRR